MPTTAATVADRLRSIAVTALGIVLALVPPALWVAWTETGLLAVAAVGVVAAALLVGLADYGGSKEGRNKAACADSRLPDEAIAELHRIFPLTYHHSLVEKARFHQAMNKLRQRLR